MSERSIEIIMQPAYRKFGYVYIPARDTGFFPPAAPQTRRPAVIISDAAPVRAELQYNSRARVWFLKMRGWFQSHPGLKAGDRIRITEIEPGVKYRFTVLS